MSADPLAPVQAGDSFELRAATWNLLLESARRSRGRKFEADGPGADGVPHRLIVPVKNDTASDFEPGDIVTASGTPLDLATYPLDADERPALKVVVSTADTDYPLVLLDGIAVGEYGPAVVLGVCVCTVKVGDATHVFAKCDPTETAHLQSAATGPARILARESGSSGNKKAIVLLGGSSDGGTLKGKLDGALAYDSSATLSVWAWNGSVEADTGVNVTVYDWPLSTGETIASGTRVTAQGLNGRYYVTGAQVRQKLKGKLDGTLSYGGSATMSVWAWNGSAEADTGVNVTVYDWLLVSGQTIASGKQVTVACMDGRYYVTGAQCV